MENDFNPDSNKEVIFTQKTLKPNHPPLSLNNILIVQTPSQKHLGMFLDSRLDFQEHLKSILNKVNKTIALLHKFQNILPRPSNRLSGLTSTRGISSMTNLITPFFIKKWIQFNKTPH